MVRAEAYDRADLDQIYRKLDEAIDEDWLKRLEPDFGDVEEHHLFVQSDSFNGFLYKDRAILHILNKDAGDPVYDILDEFYNLEED